MGSLDGVVHDAHSEAQLDRTQRILDGAPPAIAAQIAHSGKQSRRDVDRVAGLELRPACMRDAGLVALRFATSAFTFATAARELQFHLLHEIDLALILFGIASVN